jgi:hypothetical protein
MNRIDTASRVTIWITLMTIAVMVEPLMPRKAM